MLRCLAGAHGMPRARPVSLATTMGASMDQCLPRPVLGCFQAPWAVGFSAGLLSLALCGAPMPAHAFTMTSTLAEAPAVQTQMVGQAALEEAFAEGEGTTLQLSDALSVYPQPGEPRSAFALWAVRSLQGLLLAILGLWGLHTLRQWLLTMNRVSDVARDPYAGIVEGAWPKLSVIVLAHNSQALVGEALEALCQADYPAGQWQIVAVNDRSTDRTRQIIDEQAARHAGLVVPVHRNHGLMGRAACLLSAMPHVDGDILLVLGAEHRVGPALLKQLMAPFFDPEVGSVSGRAMPLNVQANWMTRLSDLSLSAQQQVEQAARNNLGLLPPVSGLVAWRRSALVAACAASSDAMADAVDVALRLSLRGWQQVFQAGVDAHVVVPQTWASWRLHLLQQARARQVAAARHSWSLLASPHLSGTQKLDGLLSSLQAVLPALLGLAAVCVLALHLLGASDVATWGLAVLALAACSGLVALVPQVQWLAGARLDGRHRAVRLMPLQWVLGFAGLTAQLRQNMSWLAQLLRRAWALSKWSGSGSTQVARPAANDGANHAASKVRHREADVPDKLWAIKSEAA
jgi:hypothetical protein